MTIFTTVLLIGLLFSPIAGLMAFLITYEEYKHHYSSKEIPLKEGVSAGLFTFFIFLSLSAVVGLVFSYTINT